MKSDRALLEAALDALMESRDTVWHEYESDWRHGLPTRKAQLDVMREIAENHDHVIAEIKARLAKTEPVRFGVEP